jgi:hypothetical protein
MPSTLFKALVRLIITTLFVACAGVSAAQDFRHIQNRWEMDQHLHIERGAIMAGRIEPDWWSAMRVIENVPGMPYVQFHNRCKPEQFLHIE